MKFELKNISDKDLLKGLRLLTSNEVETVAKVLLHLAEVEKRRLYLEEGYPSLFAYCVGALKYCEGSAGRRVVAARSIQRFPKLLPLLKDRKITLSTIVLISKILSEQNFEEVSSAVINRNKDSVERYVASFLPKKQIREHVKAVSSCAGFTGKSKTSTPLLTSAADQSDVGNIGAEMKDSLNEAQSVVFEIKVRALDSTVVKLKRVQEIRGKRESLGELFESLLDDYLLAHSPEERINRRALRVKKKQEKKITTGRESLSQETLPTSGEAKNKDRDTNRNKRVDLATPNGANHDKEPDRSGPLAQKREGFEGRCPQQVRSRYIPKKIRDELYVEHNGQCAFVTKDGTRCNERRRLQVDHIVPFGLGGGSGRENLRLLCPAHNNYAAERIYGREFMAKYVGRER